MSQSIDFNSYFAFNPGIAGEVLIPMMPGSQMETDPNSIDEMLAANGIQEPVARWQGLCQPVALIKTHLLIGSGQWTAAALLRKMTGAADNTGAFGANRPATGILPSCGSVRWKYGDEAPRQWTASKIERLIIEWEGVGTSPVATLIVMPYGATASASAALTGAPFFGQLPAAQNMTYSDTLDSVTRGVLAFQNALEPIPTTPADADTDGNFYVQEFSNGPLRFAVTVEQTHAATHIPAPTLTTPAPLTVIFRDAANANPVTFDTLVLPPSTGGTVRMSNARTVRNYKSARTVSTPSLRIY
jgi:hypothetical protein